MLAQLKTLVRAALVALVIVFAVPVADARPTGATHSQTTAHTTTATETAPQEGVTLEGVLLIGGIIGSVIFFAWVCSRIGDANRPTMP